MPWPAITSRVVERMDERQPVARGELLGFGARLGQVGAVQHDAGAELAAVGHLDQRRELRHHHGHRDAEQAAVVGDALRVIAGGRGDHAALALRPASSCSSALRAPRSLKLPVRCR